MGLDRKGQGLSREAHQNTFEGESIHFDVDRHLPYKYMSMSNYAKYANNSEQTLNPVDTQAAYLKALGFCNWL